MPATSLVFAHKNISNLSSISSSLKRYLQSLDLSNNSITDLSQLSNTPNLTTLILNNNRITDTTFFPPLLNLKTLWVAKNEICNIHRFITMIEKSCPHLTDLLLLGNECCPSYLNNRSKREYTEYRHFVISRLPTIKVLDCAPVTDSERLSAIKHHAVSLPKAESLRRSFSIPMLHVSSPDSPCFENRISTPTSLYTPEPTCTTPKLSLRPPDNRR
ncbi:hypothetical protein P9112_004457 [Eukaryota sp. TZLM1-RC]